MQGLLLAVFVLPLLPVVLGFVAGDALRWQAAALFGVAPDATALGTLGLLIALGAIPFLWCLVSGTLLWNLWSS